VLFSDSGYYITTVFLKGVVGYGTVILTAGALSALAGPLPGRRSTSFQLLAVLL
jgi:hypothetical protein